MEIQNKKFFTYFLLLNTLASASEYNLSYLLMFHQYIFYSCSTGLIFGAITCAAGITGVLIGAESSRRFRNRIPYADAIICGVGLLGSAPFVYVSLFLAEVSLPLVWVRVSHC